MLNYIAVNVPPSEDGLYSEGEGDVIQPQAGSTGWSMAEKTTWMIMTATTSVLIQASLYSFTYEFKSF
jgi:hypothetical protein